MPDQIEPVYHQLGLRVRAIREAVGMTQEELAKRTGLTRPSIVNFETGRQRILLAQVERLAAALNSTPKHLLRGIWT